jgi:phosphoribosylformimino-5-aminoimidazole carboxamide ribotide isomerase
VLILPAIDLRGGLCVRLRQGDYGREQVFADDPAEMAQEWVSQGARYLHLVDLDGARLGKPINEQVLCRIIGASNVPCQLGGGIRTESDIGKVFSWGADRVVIGTQALQNPHWFERMCQRFPKQIALGIDARNGLAATNGWMKASSLPALDLARRCQDLSLAALIYTDINRDGMLAGPNLAELAEIAQAVRLPVIASGGVATLEDVRQLARLPLAGCIIGRALYEGRLRLAEAIRVANSTA